MNALRTFYAAFTVITIIAGLLVRSLSAYLYPVINLYAGDALYAVMVYFIVSFIRPRNKAVNQALIGLVICYAIEFSQLYQAPWINAVRQTLPGRLVLGSGFLYSDLLAYAIGIIAALVLDRYFISLRKQRA